MSLEDKFAKDRATHESLTKPLPCEICRQDNEWKFNGCENACAKLVSWYAEQARLSFAKSVKEHHGEPDDDS